MNDIVLKAYFLNKLLVWFLFSAAISTFLIFFGFDIPREDRFILSTCIIGAETYFMFFLNRFEPKYIKLFDKKFEVSFVNHKYFEKPESIYDKPNVKVISTKEMILLFDEGGTIAKIRKKALNHDDWDTIKKYFSGTISTVI